MMRTAPVPGDARTRRVAWAGFAALLAFVACAVAMSTGATTRLDDLGLRWMHAHAAPSLDAPAHWLARAGYGRGVLPFDALLVLALLAVRRWREALFVSIALGGGLLLNRALKLAFARPRPVLDWPAGEMQATFAFPSGHAMATAALATVLTLLVWPSRGRWPVVAIAWGFALLVGMSRVLLGVHHPADVLAGWTMGIAWPALAWCALSLLTPMGRPSSTV